MYILGISAFYHDSAACLVQDGKVLAAVQEERFTRKKHEPRFPKNAVKSCLEEADIKIQDVDHVVFYDKPFLTFDRLLMSYLTVAPKGLRSWLQAMPLWLGQKLYIPKVIKRETGYEGDVLFTKERAWGKIFPLDKWRKARGEGLKAQGVRQGPGSWLEI